MSKLQTVTFALLLVLYNGSSFAQESAHIRGKIVDSKSSVTIPFATILLRGEQGTYGLVSNADGGFQIPIKYKAIVDTIIVSCIGYTTKKVLIDNVNDAEINVLRLDEATLRLAEVEILGRRRGRLTAAKIVKAAISNIQYNYPVSDNSYAAYYRDYQVRDNQYINLNEAIVEIFDKGFDENDYQTTQTSLYLYKQNQEFERDTSTEIAYDNHTSKFIPGAVLYPFGGNELMILRIHDAIRNNKTFSHSYINVLQKNFVRNHMFDLVETVYLNETPLYHISFQALESATGTSHTAHGEIFIEHGNYAIHKLEYSTYEKVEPEDKLLYNVQVEYVRVNALMHLNYISFNNFFKLANPLDFKVVDMLINRDLNAFVVRFNNKPERESAGDLQNYVYVLDGREMKTEKISILSEENIVVVYLSEELPALPATKLAEMSELKFGPIRDSEGRKLNENTYIPVNQFREIFVQKFTSQAPSLPDSLYVEKNLPLSENTIAKESGNFPAYWMNTPLKGEVLKLEVDQ